MANYRVSVSMAYDVGVTCENCNHEYSYPKEYSAWSQRSSASAAKAEAQRLANMHLQGYGSVSQGSYGVKACPQCGYFQSWMLSKWYQEKIVPVNIVLTLITAGVLLLLALPGCNFERGECAPGGLPMPILLMLFLLAIIMVILNRTILRFIANRLTPSIFKANKGFNPPQQRNKPQITNVRQVK